MNTAVGDTQGPERRGRGSQTGSGAGLGQVGPGPPPQGAVVGGRQRTHRSLGPGPPSTVVAGLQPAGWSLADKGDRQCPVQWQGQRELREPRAWRETGSSFTALARPLGPRSQEPW